MHFKEEIRNEFYLLLEIQRHRNYSCTCAAAAHIAAASAARTAVCRLQSCCSGLVVAWLKNLVEVEVVRL